MVLIVAPAETGRFAPCRVRDHSPFARFAGKPRAAPAAPGGPRSSPGQDRVVTRAGILGEPVLGEPRRVGAPGPVRQAQANSLSGKSSWWRQAASVRTWS